MKAFVSVEAIFGMMPLVLGAGILATFLSDGGHLLQGVKKIQTRIEFEHQSLHSKCVSKILDGSGHWKDKSMIFWNFHSQSCDIVSPKSPTQKSKK